MKRISAENIAKVFRRALNLIDYRLVDHGDRVAYLVLKMILKEGNYSKNELVKICYLCMMHDIGALKTEKVDSLADVNALVSFELEDTFPHSVYGSIFLKYFSPISEYADNLIYHHFPYNKLIQSACNNKPLVSKLFLADRSDIFYIKNMLEISEEFYSNLEPSLFNPKDVELLISCEKESGIFEKLDSGEYLQELYEFFNSVILTDDELLSFLQTLIYTIDFRSEFTVMHTITTIGLSLELGKQLGVSESDLTKIHYGSLLHDIGKISTSIMVLEKSSRLNDFEYKMIKDHVVVTEHILKDIVDDEIVKIAARHHEKLDGSGYPRGLLGTDLNLNERIVAVADIFSALVGKRSYKDSFPEEKIKSIIKEMAEENKICKDVANVVIEKYNEIIDNVLESCKNTLEQYNNMHDQFETIVKTNKI